MICAKKISMILEKCMLALCIALIAFFAIYIHWNIYGNPPNFFKMSGGTIGIQAYLIVMTFKFSCHTVVKKKDETDEILSYFYGMFSGWHRFKYTFSNNQIFDVKFQASKRNEMETFIQDVERIGGLIVDRGYRIVAVSLDKTQLVQIKLIYPKFSY